MASKLIGTTVVSTNNESIGDVNDVILDRNGQVMAVVVGVGGFLGIGEKDVAVPFASLEFASREQMNTANNAGRSNVTSTGSTTGGPTNRSTATTGNTGGNGASASPDFDQQRAGPRHASDDQSRIAGGSELQGVQQRRHELEQFELEFARRADSPKQSSQHRICGGSRTAPLKKRPARSGRFFPAAQASCLRPVRNVICQGKFLNLFGSPLRTWWAGSVAGNRELRLNLERGTATPRRRCPDDSCS